LGHDELAALLTPLVASSSCVGLDVTVFDPDLDPDGGLALDLTDTLVAGPKLRLPYRQQRAAGFANCLRGA
jgi:hypothetical protein